MGDSEITEFFLITDISKYTNLMSFRLDEILLISKVDQLD